MNTRPTIGLITFGDNREYEWDKYFRRLAEPLHTDAISYFSSLPINLVSLPGVARFRDDIDYQVSELKKSAVEAVIFHVPCWTFANLVVRAGQALQLPIVLLSNKSPSTTGSVGMLAAGGALSQVGIEHLRVRGDFNTSNSGEIAEKVMPFFRAAHTICCLHGEIYGQFGGRSLGIDTATHDPIQWKKIFGVDTEHIDQLEIIRRAPEIPEQRTIEMLSWIKENVSNILYDDDRLTPAKLELQARCYLATKDLIKEKGLDFAGIKCQQELSGHYVAQCISCAFLPDPYDAEGTKNTVNASCEADADGMLSMQILKHLSGGKPVLFMDLSYIDAEHDLFYLGVCAMSTWYASRSDDPKENLKKVTVRPILRPAGGGTPYFIASPGPITLARLYRKDGCYYMAILSGDVIELSPEKLESFNASRGTHLFPMAFIQIEINVDKFFDEFGSNHIAAVAGDFVQDLRQFCSLKGIEPIEFTRS